MDNFYARCVLTPGRSPACHSQMTGSPRKCQVLQDQAPSLPWLLSASTISSTWDGEVMTEVTVMILRLVMAAWLLELCLLASVVHARGGHTNWDPSGSIPCMLMQRSAAALRLKGLGISETSGSLAHPKKRSTRIKYPKWRLLSWTGDGLQCHTALAATVVVFFCERHKGYVEKTHKHNDWKCGICEEQNLQIN